jgi:hypothetical protein
MVSLFNQDFDGAILSNDRKYRYKLWRTWDEKKLKVLFIMLNPSIANESENDPTIRRCITFAKDWGYGGIMVGNLYAFITSDPKILYKQENKEGSENKLFLEKMYLESDITICAWGNNEQLPEYIKNMGTLYYLELSKNEIPKHPLYLKKSLTPKRWLV